MTCTHTPVATDTHVAHRLHGQPVSDLLRRQLQVSIAQRPGRHDLRCTQRHTRKGIVMPRWPCCCCVASGAAACSRHLGAWQAASAAASSRHGHGRGHPARHIGIFYPRRQRPQRPPPSSLAGGSSAHESSNMHTRNSHPRSALCPAACAPHPGPPHNHHHTVTACKHPPCPAASPPHSLQWPWGWSWAARAAAHTRVQRGARRGAVQLRSRPSRTMEAR